MGHNTSWELGNKTYILNEEQTREVEAYSDSEPNDAVFNKWFKDYVVKNNVKSREYGRAKYWSHVPNWSSDVDKLTYVKQSALTLMQVVDPKIESTNIMFDENTDGRLDAVIIPSLPATDARDLHTALDDTAGFAIHAAFTRLFKPDARYLPGDQIRTAIQNSLDSLRASALGLRENPGFADYIESATNYLYNGYKLPAEFPKDAVEQLAALMSSEMYGARVGNPEDTEYESKIAVVHDVVNKYINKEYMSISDARSAVESIYSLMDIDPSDPSSGEDKKPPVPIMIGDDSVKGEMAEGDADEIERRIDMEQEIVEINPPEGSERSALLKVRPPEISYERIKQPSGLILKADAQLRLRKTLSKNTEHYQKSGDLDEDELYRLMQGDDRVFVNVEEEQEESASIHFLVDVSGSMRGSVGHGSHMDKINAAASLAWLFAHSMAKRSLVKSHVWAHTGDTSVTGFTGYSHHRGPIVYDIWQSGEPLSRLHTLVNLGMSNNHDGYAIEYVGNQILKEDAEKRYLIVLADGIPSGYGYGGEEGMLHVREVSDGLLRKGVHVIQVAIGSDLMDDQAKMFKHFVMYKDMTQTIKDFAKLLDKAR